MDRVLRVVSVWLVVGYGGVWGDEASKERFLNEAPVAWQKYKEELGAYEHVSTFRRFDENGKVTEFEQSRRVHRGEWWLSATDTRVQAINSRYGFEISRKGTGADETWKLNVLVMNWRERPAKQLAEEEYIFRLRDNFVPGLIVYQYRLNEVMQDPAFSVQDVRFTNDGMDEVCEVRFEVDVKAPLVPGKVESIDGLTAEEWTGLSVATRSLALRRRDTRTMRSGVVRFLPDMHWLIRRAEVCCEFPVSGERADATTQYEHDRESMPVPTVSKHTVNVRIQGAAECQFRNESEHVFERYEGTDEKEFKLSSFGLEEPVE